MGKRSPRSLTPPCSPVTAVKAKPCFVCLTLLLAFRSKTTAVSQSPVVLLTLCPLSLTGCLFVVMSLFLFIIQDLFFLFYQQHASTNATMVFNANCDVHYFHCCSILFRDYFLPALTGKANNPPFFLYCDLRSFFSLSAVFCPP